MDRHLRRAALLPLTMAALVVLAGCEQPGPNAPLVVKGGQPDRAPRLMRYYGCASCHTIPGVPTANGRIGPPLKGLRERAFIGGVLSNNPDNLVAWIQNPRAIAPGTAMPHTGIPEQEARDVAAYLYAR